MSRKYYFLLLVSPLILFNFCFSEKKPKLDLSLNEYNFGTIRKDSIYNGDIIIKNSGNVPLVIESVNPDCGCTAVHISKHTILPKDTCTLTFAYKTHNKKGYQENFISLIANTDSIVHILQINSFVE